MDKKIPYSLLVIVVIALFIVSLSTGHGSQTPNNPVEVGSVRWTRDFNAALVESERTGKPIFLLFQEIPGCIGCRNFGKEVLTYPLLVEAIENEFLPVLVYNNRKGGKDEALLKRFNEPSWNFQVIRFLDGKGMDVIPRRHSKSYPDGE